MREYLARALPRIWQDRRHPAVLLLSPLSFIYGLVTRLHRWMYATGLMAITRMDMPVIVVGNITVGGTGKTPLVIWLVDYLVAAGYRPGIVSRGYGGSSPSWPVDVTASEKAEVVGDEAIMLRQRSGVPLAVSPDRADAAQLLLRDHGVDIIVSDDGLQHLALARDLEIVVIDAARKFGNGRLLPAGPLREPPAVISERAILVYSTGPDPGQQEYTMHLEPVRFVNLANPQRQLGVDAFSGQRVNAVAGIGAPEKFFATLEQLGIRPLRNAFADHHVFRHRDLRFENGLPVVMTEKDAVKCAGLTGADAWYLEVTARPNQPFVRRLDRALEELSP